MIVGHSRDLKKFTEFNLRMDRLDWVIDRPDWVMIVRIASKMDRLVRIKIVWIVFKDRLDCVKSSSGLYSGHNT